MAGVFFGLLQKVYKTVTNKNERYRTLSSAQKSLHSLVQQQGRKRDDDALDDIEGNYCEENQGRDAGDGRVDLGAHADDDIQRHAEQLHVLGNQEVGVEQTAKYGHDGGAQNQTPDGGLFGLLAMISSLQPLLFWLWQSMHHSYRIFA